MGSCCAGKKNMNLEKSLGLKLSELIEKDAVDRIRELIIKYTSLTPSKEPLLDINQPIVKIYSQDMNALGYALFLGYTSTFAVLLELGKAKLSIMSKLYSNFGKKPIDFICELGHLSLLEYYLPLHLRKTDEYEESENDSISLSFSRSKTTKSHLLDKSKPHQPMSTLTPIHRACEKSKLPIVQYLWEYFKNRPVPDEFNVHYLDEHSGDNCAMISCKTGNLDLIRFLYEVCNADFHIFNKRRESAIQMLAVWSKKRKQRNFKDCFKYLIETVGVDYLYEFEETLLVLEDKSIVFYLEEKLKADGISISKSGIDEKYSLSKNRVPTVMDPVMEVKLSKIRGNRFNFQEVFKEELQEQEEELSSISGQSLQSVSNITFLDQPQIFK